MAHAGRWSVSREVVQEPLRDRFIYFFGCGELWSRLQARWVGQRVGQVWHCRELDVVGLCVSLAERTD
jgi:hypothetical protein